MKNVLQVYVVIKVKVTALREAQDRVVHQMASLKPSTGDSATPALLLFIFLEQKYNNKKLHNF